MTRNPLTQESQSSKVDEYMASLEHPCKAILETLRDVILEADPAIGEEIKWNAPTFFYTGEMPPSNPKEFRRYLVVSNLFKKDCIRLVFWGGARADDGSGFLSGDYADGRRLALFASVEEVIEKKSRLQAVIKKQLETMDRG